MRAHTESLLSQFLSSKGLSPASITGSPSAGVSYTSGLDRLLALMERFEASKDDVARFEQAEGMLFKVITSWLSELQGTDQLDDKYKAGTFSENASVSVIYATPQAVVSEAEELDLIERKLELGLITLEEAIAKDRNLTPEEAKEISNELGQTKIDKEGSEPGDRPKENSGS